MWCNSYSFCISLVLFMVWWLLQTLYFSKLRTFYVVCYVLIFLNKLIIFLWALKLVCFSRFLKIFAYKLFSSFLKTNFKSRSLILSLRMILSKGILEWYIFILFSFLICFLVELCFCIIIVILMILLWFRVVNIIIFWLLVISSLRMNFFHKWFFFLLSCLILVIFICAKSHLLLVRLRKSKNYFFLQIIHFWRGQFLRLCILW